MFGCSERMVIRSWYWVLPRMDSLEGLRLVPEYGDGGPKVEEAFGLTVAE